MMASPSTLFGEGNGSGLDPANISQPTPSASLPNDSLMEEADWEPQLIIDPSSRAYRGVPQSHRYQGLPTTTEGIFTRFPNRETRRGQAGSSSLMPPLRTKTFTRRTLPNNNQAPVGMT